MLDAVLPLQLVLHKPHTRRHLWTNHHTGRLNDLPTVRFCPVSFWQHRDDLFTTLSEGFCNVGTHWSVLKCVLRTCVTALGKLCMRFFLVTAKNAFPIASWVLVPKNVWAFKSILNEEKTVPFCWKSKTRRSIWLYSICGKMLPVLFTWYHSLQMPYSRSDADNSTNRRMGGKSKYENCVFELQSSCFHRWPLAVMWLLGQRDGKIHVVPFEICSCVMPAERVIARVTTPEPHSLSHIH